MRRIVVAVLFAIVVFVSAGSAKESALSSVRPFQVEVTDLETGDARLLVVCTAWATTYEQRPAWVTAAHCFSTGNPKDEHGGVVKDVWIDAKKAIPVRIDFIKDVAVLRGGPSAKPLTVSFKEGKALDPVWGVGYPGNSERQHVVAGVFSNPEDDDGMSIYALPVAGGMSGGPVIDTQSGTVVGLFRQSECYGKGWCPFSRGIPLSTLRDVLKLDAVEP